MSRQFRRKPHTARRMSRENWSHWLEQGADGQETLLLDVTPPLLTLDRAICSRATQIAFRLRGDRTRRRALVVAPPGVASWQIGFLSKHFEVFVYTPELDPILERISSAFEATLLESLDELPEHAADLILLLESNWTDSIKFLEAAQFAAEYLSSEGELLSVLFCEELNGHSEVLWSSGAKTEIVALIGRASRLLSQQFRGYESVPIVRSLFQNMAGEFLKRHREYFGKNARDLYMSHINDPEFIPDKLIGRSAVLLAWGPEWSAQLTDT